MSLANAFRSVRRSRRALFAIGVLAAGALLVGLLRSETGLQLTARALVWASDGAVHAAGVRGRLLGPIAIDRLEIASDNGRHTIANVRLAWQPRALLEGRLTIDALHIDTLTLAPPAEGARLKLPPTLRLPLAIDLASLRIARIVLADAQGSRPLAEAITAAVTSDGHRHRLKSLRLRHAQGELIAAGKIDGQAPYAVHAQAVLSFIVPLPAATEGEERLVLDLEADGPLEALNLFVRSRSPSWPVQARAQLHPFAARVLAALSIEAGDFDPRWLHAQAPGARLKVTATLGAAADAGLIGEVRIINATPAPLDRGGAPIQRAEAKLALDWRSEPRRLRLNPLTLTTSKGWASGEIELLWPAAARWPHGRAAIALHGLDPAALHGKLPAARLDGHIDFDGNASAQRASIALRDRRYALQATLARHDGTLRETKGRLELCCPSRGRTSAASSSGWVIELTRLQLTRAAARLDVEGCIALAGGHDWQLAGRLHRFDPALWHEDWPQGDLNGRFMARGRLAPETAGRLTLQLTDSVFAGQPLFGQLALDVSHLMRKTPGLGAKPVGAGDFNERNER